MKRIAYPVAIFAALTIGCAQAEDAGDTMADTATVPGTDVVEVPTQVPTTDTVVRTTTTETDVDTIEGEARDTTRRQ